MDNGKKSEKVEKVKNANDIAASVAKKIAAASDFIKEHIPSDLLNVYLN